MKVPASCLTLSTAFADRSPSFEFTNLVVTPRLRQEMISGFIVTPVGDCWIPQQMTEIHELLHNLAKLPFAS